MANLQTAPDQLIEGNDPFGMSRFSLRRYSIQHFLLIVVTHVLLIALLVTSVLWGNAALIALSALAWTVVIVKTVLVVTVGIRTIAVEAWIRRLGMGDYEHSIEPRGNDEVSKACQALETLRLRSIEVVRLELVEKLAIDHDRRRVTVGGRPVKLTATEYELLRTLALDAGRVVTYQKLLRRVWGGRPGSDEKIVRAYITRLRKRLGEEAREPLYIHTEPRVGYRMPRPGDQ